MLSEVGVYLHLGLTHIADFAAYDHIVFLLALSAIYTFADWRRVVWLVTAFTVGHSLTLVLATLRIVVIDDLLVEILIPVTILVAVVENVILAGPPGEAVPRDRPAERRTRYGLTLVFGLIHGLGFSNFLRALLGAEESLLVPLFSFNVGLEVGQLIIVGIVLTVASLATRWLVVRRDWIMVTSGAAGGVALVMLIERVAGAV